MTALVSLSVGGAVTGFSFVPKAAADFSSPSSVPLNLVALRQSVHTPAAQHAAPGHDPVFRAAIVHVARYYLQMARTRTPAEMEAIIWQHDSVDGADHGQSCAAFASLTLELGAQVTGGQSWASGGGSYPWPLHTWADVRVEPNPASPGIVSIQQDAQAHDRWHPLGDGYSPLPGDWVLFDGHVEVVTKDAGGVLYTIGGDSLPDFSVNAHEYPGPLSAAGVVGFVNNGTLPGAGPAAGDHAAAVQSAADPAPAASRAATSGARSKAGTGLGGPGAHGSLAAIPGAGTVPAARAAAQAPAEPAIPGLVPAPRASGEAPGPVPGGATQDAAPASREKASPGGAAIPGVTMQAGPGERGTAYRRHHPSPARTPVSGTRAQQAFISAVAPGAIDAQRRYGVPAAVTIAQAIDESGWGQSELAAQDHNLFGIKGTGPAGSVPLPTQEYVNGQPVATSASFRVYHDVAESIDDHGRLLARSGYYQQAMGERQHPDKFAAALTGVYATDPDYGANLISLMRRYDLYRYGQGQPAGRTATAEPGRGSTGAEPGSATIPGVPAAAPAPVRPARPASARPAPAHPSRPASPRPAPVHPAPVPSAPAASPQPTATGHPRPGPTGSPAPPATAAPRPSATGSPTTAAPGRRPPQPGTASPGPSPTAAGNRSPSRPATPGPAPAGSPRQVRTARPASPPVAPAATPAQPAAGVPGPGAAIPGAAVPGAPAAGAPDRGVPGRGAGTGAASIPGVATQSASARRLVPPPAHQTDQMPQRPRVTQASQRSGPAATRATLVSARRYQPQMPRAVLNSFVETAKAPLMAGQTTYQEVAGRRGISWQLLAACDWMQCEARARRSPVYGERLGSVNSDGTVYVQRSAALGRCADDLVRLSRAVYGVDLTRVDLLSVADLANAFAAFRWGGLLQAHDCSAMEFPYSVEGLTGRHVRMRWPRITDPGNGDRPGARFHRRFGAVPIVLSLDYPATA